MERTRSTPSSNSRFERELSHLKIISRLLGHELHTQQGSRVTLSRDSVLEIQASIDLYIEEALKARKGAATTAAVGKPGELEVQAVPARVN